MRQLSLVFSVLLFSLQASAGTIHDSFARGFAGIEWTTNLESLVSRFPGGTLTFSTSGGCRAYFAAIDDSLIGIPRAGSAVEYLVGSDRKIDGIGIFVPYSRREELLQVFVKSFGLYANRTDTGQRTSYAWKQDQGMELSVHALADQTYGVLEVLVMNPKAGASRTCPSQKTGQLAN